MAKSRDSFNKKEKEKKKIKKKQDKEEKKEARKANSSKGLSFEDMLAYVDENGNISSTPPDPTKKKTIQQENIQISISKRDDSEVQDLTRKGIVTMFNESKGYGFIKDQETQESVFVHKKAMIDLIKERDKVSFEVEKTPKGKSAINVQLLK